MNSNPAYYRLFDRIKLLRVIKRALSVREERGSKRALSSSTNVPLSCPTELASLPLLFLHFISNLSLLTNTQFPEDSAALIR
jgi:hypothetical protein